MTKAPVIFIGHGSPANAIEDNGYTREWRGLGLSVGRPRAVVCVSDRWVTKGTLVNGADSPAQIFDFFGYPKALYGAEYACPGDPALARKVRRLLGKASLDASWGVDSGVWPVLRHLFPDGGVPVVPVSIDRRLSPTGHYEVGQKLGALADEGVMILCCGNIVCNLRLIDSESENGFDWAEGFSYEVKSRVLSNDAPALIEWEKLPAFDCRVLSSPYHFYPLLYALGAAGENCRARVVCDSRTAGSVDMTGFVFTRE
ncbi:MAG: dioxygenase [Clostridia bacterium]|nr:dioxygenase [Clostridia bacterium]